MEPSSSQSVVAFESSHRAPCQEVGLVLQAIGIPSEVVHDGSLWCVAVDARHHSAAVEEIEDYLRDKSAELPRVESRVKLFGGAILGGVFYVSILVSVAILDNISAYGMQWGEAGSMRAGAVMSGQIWRTVTALTLHADTLHLMSNLVFGGFFGLLAGRIFGGGVAWLAILIAGAMGNGLNAALREAAHTSIGASTAVFAALGILVAHALRPRAGDASTPMQRWSPLIAGVLMFAFLGLEGERTDVLAHTTGFVSGLIIGGLGSRLPERVLASERFQFAAAGMALAILVVSWGIAAIAR
ncbi:rhomboid family intramembrane serine protease [Aporhodopirellula aestuarii]|uniref:Rhomboid family intramembrane serine protease n=1 Tax=Aporhodopirellula aestuarii TaxID=2950107 RepID=A0ABT0U551_9BACT|nr:rhomboid family intramembrane serine protease [Aporhodopirellula aestuarii]MCM2372042.1 rhomboid family intramembrane serine protease [Aporhodopirellula aestuarii]